MEGLVTSSMEKRDQRVLRILTSHDFRWGSKAAAAKPSASFFEAEKDFVRRSSGKNDEVLEGLGGGGGRELEAGAAAEDFEKRDLKAAAAELEEVDGRREDEEGLLLLEAD